MKKIISFLSLSVVMVSLSSGVAFADGIKFFKGTWEEALAEADKTGKLLFVDAYATWCGPCNYMSEDVFPDAEVGKFYNENFIAYKIDVDEDRGGEIFGSYGGTAMPTYLFVDGQGGLIYKQVGAVGPEDFIKVGKKALEAPKLKDKYENGTATEAEKMGYIMMMNVDSYDAPEFQYFLTNVDKFIEYYEGDALDFYGGVLEKEYEKATTSGDTENFKALLTHLDKFEDLLPPDFNIEEFKTEVLAELE